MGKVVPLLLVLMLGCVVNSRHAEVKLANNPVGAECFARCAAANSETEQAVDCVELCPGAEHDSGTCDEGTACVEHKRMSFWKIALYALGTVVLYAAATGQL